MRYVGKWLIVLVVVALTGCSGESSVPTAADEVGRETSLTSTTEANPHPTTVVVSAEDEFHSAVPISADPCLTPAAHSFGQFVEYEAELAGETVPVAVKVGSPGALDGGLLIVALHGAGVPWKVAVEFGRVDSLIAAEWPEDERIVVAPQTQPGDQPFWNQYEGFNVEFLADFFSLLDESVCTDQSPVLLHSLGQGSLAATEALCADAYPIDVHVFGTGLLKTVECQGVTQPVIVSVDQFAFSTLIGHHWDGEWSPPGPGEAERTGGIQATPDDLAVVADQYGCDGAAKEMVFDSAEFDRAPVMLAYDDGCAAALRAYGLPAIESQVGWDPAALKIIEDPLREDLLAALDR